MAAVFLTGATGMIGANIAAALAARGDHVRALVRTGAETGALEALGVEIVRGDIVDAEDVLRAARGTDYAIHSAAVLGGVSQDVGEHEAVNVRGTANVYDAAAKLGLKCTVGLTTITFFDYHDTPLTEHSPLDPRPTSDPYTLTKRAAYLDAMARAEAGQDIRIIVPGAAFGRSPLPARTMVAPSWNQRFADAIEGKLSEYLSFKIPFVDAADVAAATLAALDNGRRGERYLAFGGQDDILTLPEFCNLACELAGSPHRVAAVPPERLDDPEVLARYGPSIVALAKKPQPEPLFRYGQTIERLGYRPTPMREALAATIPWLREHDLMAG